MLVIDLSGVIVFANPYCEILYGRGPDDLVGESGLKFTYPITPELMDEIGEPSSTGGTGRASSASRARTARRSTCTRSTSPVFDDNGKVDGVISLAFDVDGATRCRTTSSAGSSRSRRSCATSARRSSPSSTPDQVMKTVTAAARKLTGASMARVPPRRSRRARRLPLRARGIGSAARVVARRRHPDRHAAARRRAREPRLRIRVDDAAVDERIRATRSTRSCRRSSRRCGAAS